MKLEKSITVHVPLLIDTGYAGIQAPPMDANAG
jgi:hypothetical protein